MGTTSSSAVDNDLGQRRRRPGTESSIGGLVGAADLGSTLRNAYATGNVAGSLQVGGLVSYNQGLIEHVFATGDVSASSNGYVGGLVGHNPTEAGGSVNDGWFRQQHARRAPGQWRRHVDSSGEPDFGIAGRFRCRRVGQPGRQDHAVSQIRTRRGVREGGKRHARRRAGLRAGDHAGAAAGDQRRPGGPLRHVRGDIDATATRDWNSGAGFVPIGNFAGGLDGRFDELGHVVEDLFIHRVDAICVGLFGGIGIGGVVRNVGVDGGAVTGGVLVGGLVGYSDAGEIRQAPGRRRRNGRPERQLPGRLHHGQRQRGRRHRQR